MKSEVIEKIREMYAGMSDQGSKNCTDSVYVGNVRGIIGIEREPGHFGKITLTLTLPCLLTQESEQEVLRSVVLD